MSAAGVYNGAGGFDPHPAPTTRTEEYAAGIVGCFVAVAVLSWIAALVTHIVISIQASAWLLLVIGAIVQPVGVVHGVGHWFGAW